VGTRFILRRGFGLRPPVGRIPPPPPLITIQVRDHSARGTARAPDGPAINDANHSTFRPARANITTVSSQAAWPFVGNERSIRALQNAVAGAVQHAYLFTGPEQTGRATAARILAQALNCTAETAPCGECAQCRRIASGIHTDVRTVRIEETAQDAAARKSITIEQIREVEASVALNPYEGRTRVVIIDPAEALSDAAQSAFLKTLEEPPAHVVFVLICHHADGVLETIRSRCSRVEFSLVAAAAIEQALLDRGENPYQARLLTRLAAGRPGWALAAAADPASLERRATRLEVARGLPAVSLAERLATAERMSDAFKRDREPTLQTLAEWQAWWRDVLLAQEGAEEGIANIDLLDEARADASLYRRDDVRVFVASLLRTATLLRENVQSRIALDALMLDVPVARVSPAVS